MTWSNIIYINTYLRYDTGAEILMLLTELMVLLKMVSLKILTRKTYS